MKTPDNQSRGAQAELRFALRLEELGYELIFRPSHRDVGVDFVVFTRKGWLGVQVKTSTLLNRGNKTKMYRGLDLSGGSKQNHRKGKSWYKSRGVDVIAAAAPEGFFLVPLDEMDAEKHYNLKGKWFEAWYAVFGDPIGSGDESEDENPIDQLELMWAKS